jgi:hypothetical protein
MINLSKGPWNKPPFLAYYSEPKPIKLLCEDIPAPEKVLAYAATMKFSHYQLVLKDEKGLSRAVALKVLQEVPPLPVHKEPGQLRLVFGPELRLL